MRSDRGSYYPGEYDDQTGRGDIGIVRGTPPVGDSLPGTFGCGLGILPVASADPHAYAARSRPPPWITIGPVATYVSSGNALLEWATDETADSRIQFGTSPSLGQQVSVPESVMEHRVVLAGLDPGTTYYFRAVSTDSGGNEVASPVSTFVSALSPDTQAPVIVQEPALTYVSDTLTIVEWTTNEPANSRVDFGLTQALGETVANTTLVSGHRVLLSGLAPATTYWFHVASTDLSGNGPVASLVSSFETPPEVDTTAPVVANLQLTYVSVSMAIVEWTTSEPAVGQVQFGPTAELGEVATQEGFVTEHRVLLAKLIAGSQYSFRVESADPAGNNAVSALNTMNLPATPDTSAPVLTEATVTLLSETVATVRWQTDEPSWSALESGTSTAYGSVRYDLAFRVAHQAWLTNLVPGTVYYCRIRSWDPAGNVALHDFSFLTVVGATPTPSPSGLTPTPSGPTPTPTPPRDAPTGLTAAAGHRSVALQWTASYSPGVAGYNLYRGVQSGSYDLAPVNGPSLVAGTTFLDTSAVLVSGQRYFYIVRASGPGGESQPSNEASALVGEVSLWVPAVNAGAGTSGVIVPVNIANADGLAMSAAQVFIGYDSSVLTPAGVQRRILSDGYGFGESHETPGEVRIAIAAGESPVLTGLGALFTITFDVANDATAGGVTGLTFVRNETKIWDETYSEVPLALTDGAFTVKSACVRGDVDGNGAVEAVDASIALAIAVGKRDQDSCAQSGGDIDGDGTIMANDASMISTT
ncbi:MAG: hypothetical protein HYV63_17690 [Candidatus Schekmanbacteria bacterium]|nr:hypothetical protein [Candidatus Schekmanbacteria bacterium]